MRGSGVNFNPLALVLIVVALLAVLTIQHSWAQETELEVPPGEIRARIGETEATIAVSDVRIEPRLLLDAAGEIVHVFGRDGPFVLTLRGAQDDDEAPPHYGLKFAIAPSAGSGTVVSSDPSVVSLVKQDFEGVDADADGIITRRLVTGQPGSARLAITWRASTGQVINVGIDIIVTPTDLSIVDVPDFAEDDAGGFAAAGTLFELSLSYSKSASKVELLAIEGENRLRLWADRARTRPLALPLRLDAETGPRRLFAEPVGPSERVRDMRLRLNTAGVIHLGDWDTVSLTAVDMALSVSSPVVGLNDDDDDLNDQKDYEQSIVTAGDDDLRPLIVRVHPFAEAFGRRTLDVSGGISIWKSPDKTSGAPVVDALSSIRAPVILEGPDQEQTFHMEGITTLAPPLVRLEFAPHLAVAGRAIPIGPVIRKTLDLAVVQADLDIAEFADVGNAEWITGGVVPVNESERPVISDLKEIRLHVRPGQAPIKAVRLAVPRGAQHIKLWRPKGDGPGERDVLVPIELQGETHSTILAHYDPPDSIYVQGLSESGERGLELVLSIHVDPAATDFAHEDRITLTVTRESPSADALSLRPYFVIVPNEITEPVNEQLRVLLDRGDDSEQVDVAVDPQTQYEWVGKGLNDLIDQSEYPIAQLEMSNPGVLAILSPGIQFVRARHGELVSAPMLIIAGFALDEIELVDGIQRLVPAFDGCDDFVGIGGPGEGLWLLVVLGEEAIDGGLEVDDGVENAAFQAPLRQPGEEALHRVEP